MTKIQVRKQFTTKKTCLYMTSELFSIWRRYKFESNSQRCSVFFNKMSCCFQYDEDTSSKAIHNVRISKRFPVSVVFNMTKIQVRKQFTTLPSVAVFTRMLFSIWRRYKFESNSQLQHSFFVRFCGCFQYDEDTSSKAIHNVFVNIVCFCFVVFNMTKIQVRKQFTTRHECT